VNRILLLAGFRAVVLDNNLEAIQTMRRFGIKGFFGDPTRPELLHAAGLPNAAVLVVALDDMSAAVRLVRYARKQRPDLHIVARAQDRVSVYELYHAGADDIVREMFDSSLRAGRYVLENLGLTDSEALKIEDFFFRKDREGLRELATLWRPDIPVSQNQPYIQRSRELNAELETALAEHLDEEREANLPVPGDIDEVAPPLDPAPVPESAGKADGDTEDDLTSDAPTPESEIEPVRS
jgi:CPA2 family monovalent cation:H+ antiporter-2